MKKLTFIILIGIFTAGCSKVNQDKVTFDPAKEKVIIVAVTPAALMSRTMLDRIQVQQSKKSCLISPK
jgi:PBP1b-binding outer membrane lipoprotein LpoB